MCKISSFGGTDASIKPFSEGSRIKLATACRRFLISPSNDKSLRKWAVEGLSYLTLDADVKEELVQDKAAVQAIIELAKVCITVLIGPRRFYKCKKLKSF